MRYFHKEIQEVARKESTPAGLANTIEGVHCSHINQDPYIL